jgi:hypothetical protein
MWDVGNENTPGSQGQGTQTGRVNRHSIVGQCLELKPFSITGLYEGPSSIIHPILGLG